MSLAGNIAIYTGLDLDDMHYNSNKGILYCHRKGQPVVIRMTPYDIVSTLYPDDCCSDGLVVYGAYMRGGCHVDDKKTIPYDEVEITDEEIKEYIKFKRND
jgi:hypothetical protein